MRVSYSKYSFAQGVRKVKTKTTLIIMTLGLALGGGSGLSLALLGTTHAASGYTLFGDAVYVHPGENSPTAVQATWSQSQPYGGIDYNTDGLTVSQLNNLSTDYKFTVGTCSQGSPRFQINVDGKNVFAYLGPQFPSTNTCAGNTYSNSGNVIGSGSKVDASQLGNGYETWSDFQGQHGGDAVTGIQLVVDGYTTPDITAQFDNTMISSTTYDYDVIATGSITSPTAGEHVSGTLNLAATYNDGDTPNNDDAVQWAVRAGTCAAGTNTVFGNVDGHNDSYSWDGNNFSASLDIRNVTPGSYCFVFNPVDDPGQPNVRVTQDFYIDQYYPAAKSDCMNGGYASLHDNSGNTFSNQGLCVSWVEHNVNGNGTPAANKPSH